MHNCDKINTNTAKAIFARQILFIINAILIRILVAYINYRTSNCKTNIGSNAVVHVVFVTVMVIIIIMIITTQPAA